MPAERALPSSEAVVREFFAEVVSREELIRRHLGPHWNLLFQAIRNHVERLRFSDDPSESAFFIDRTTKEFVFFTGGFRAFRSAVTRLVGPIVTANDNLTHLELSKIGDAAYALHEIFHPEQGFSHFGIVQDHKKVPSGYDQIGKIDHIADVRALTLLAAVHAARTGSLNRIDYLKKVHQISYILNRATPLAFEVPSNALHKQKRRLMNWMIFARLDDALHIDASVEVERAVGPLDAPLWMELNLTSGDLVLSELEPTLRVLGTGRIRPTTLQRVLRYVDYFPRNDISLALQLLLRRLRISAHSVLAKAAVS